MCQTRPRTPVSNKHHYKSEEMNCLVPIVSKCCFVEDEFKTIILNQRNIFNILYDDAIIDMFYF